MADGPAEFGVVGEQLAPAGADVPDDRGLGSGQGTAQMATDLFPNRAHITLGELVQQLQEDGLLNDV